MLLTVVIDMVLQKGDNIPVISLTDKNGEDFQLDRFTGIKPVVVYFYPKNFTSGCTLQACEFRDKYQDFVNLGAEVIAISSDSEFSHQRFAVKFALPFIFLSDPEKKARKAFGVKQRLFGLIPGRETFVFDKNGTLVMQYSDLSAAHHAVNALEVVRKISN